MKSMKSIAALAAFAAAFILSVGIARLIQPEPVVRTEFQTRFVYRDVPRPMNPIEMTIWQDHRNGDLRRIDEGARADRYMQYWKDSSSIDVSATPRDFQRAWDLHMQAWKNYVDYLAIKERGGVARNAQSDVQYNAEISRTWADVMRIGRSYGAEIED